MVTALQPPPQPHIPKRPAPPPRKAPHRKEDSSWCWGPSPLSDAARAWGELREMTWERYLGVIWLSVGGRKRRLINKSSGCLAYHSSLPQEQWGNHVL